MRTRKQLLFICFAATIVGRTHSVQAQTIGTFRWQQQPYCNVITLTVVQSGDSYVLNGYDDQCGAARRGSVVGVAFSNPNGTIGLGLTIVTNGGDAAGGAPVHVDAIVNLASISGNWNDSAGNAGTWAFLQGTGIAGPPRPPGGLGAVALAPGAVTSAALAQGAVTTDKLAPSAFAGSGAATTVARSDHNHAGSVFAGLIGVAQVSGGGAIAVQIPGTNLVTSRTGPGNYLVTIPGVAAGPGCGASPILPLAVVTAASDSMAATSASGKGSCPAGDLLVVVRLRLNSNGAPIDGPFTVAVFLGRVTP